LKLALIALLYLPAAIGAVPVDLSGVRPGPISVTESANSLTVKWPAENNRTWTAEFSLDPKTPLITAMSVEGKPVIQRARPWYHVETGKRRGGWD
jgi:hypothetical protein